MHMLQVLRIMFGCSMFLGELLLLGFAEEQSALIVAASCGNLKRRSGWTSRGAWTVDLNTRTIKQKAHNIGVTFPTCSPQISGTI